MKCYVCKRKAHLYIVIMEGRALRNAICLICLQRAMNEQDELSDIEKWKKKIRQEA